MANERQIDVGLMVLIARQAAKEKAETGVYGVDSHDGNASVQVAYDSLSEVSIPDVWTWEERLDPNGSPWRASTIIAGVKFFALFTDEEKRAVIDGE